MKTAYIFHDAFSDQYSDWYGWMKTTLEGSGYSVIVPQLPTPAGQSYESWRSVIKNYIPTFNEETILIGHGTGGIFGLRLIEESPKQLHGLFLVASYAEKIGHEGYDRLNETFIDHTFQWDKIKTNAMVIESFIGQQDPFVPLEISENLAKNLGIVNHSIPEGGHINKASGFTQVVVIAQTIKESLGAISTTITKQPLSEETLIQQPTGIVPGISLGTSLQSATQDDQSQEIPVEKPEIKDLSQKPVVSQKKDSDNIHTMYEDMSTLVNSNQGSVASALLTQAHTEEKIKKARSPISPKNILYTLGTFVALVITIGIALYLLQLFAPAPKNSLAPKIPSLLLVDSHQKVDVSKKTIYDLESEIRKVLTQTQPEKTVRSIYYEQNGLRISFTTLLEKLEINSLPEELKNEFSKPMFTHGSVTANNKSFFLMIPIAHYDVVFSEMKNWEPTLVRDLGVLFNVPQDFLRTKLTKDLFHNELISNKQVRVVRYQKPAESLPENPPMFLDQGLQLPEEVADVVLPTETTNIITDTTVVNSDLNFISQGIETVINKNPFIQIHTPYQENELMLSYFFLNPNMLVITDDSTIIPEILKRYANQQIY